VHEMATTLQPGDQVPMSWEEYEALAPDVRGEYVDGALVVSPGAGGRHQDISLNLAIILKRALPSHVRVREAWGWKPKADEFVPALMAFDVAAVTDDRRLSSVPHLVVEILSTDRAADLVRKAAKYGAAGLERYWVVDPEGPVVIEHELVGNVLMERARQGAGTTVTLDAGPVTVTFDPAALVS